MSYVSYDASDMRTHRQIIDDANGATALAEKLHPLLIGRWETAKALANTIQAWKRQNDGEGSIPAEYWQALSDLEVATLEELAAAKAQGVIVQDAAA